MKKTLVGIFLWTCVLSAAFAKIWQVGLARTYTFCSQVAPLVQHGDTVQIDYAVYMNDAQVIWNKNNLWIIGVGGRPRLQAGSKIANDASNGKGIFVISGANVRVENIEFANATVRDHNGAGIRQEGANLLVTRCKFDGNEMGILCGNIPNCKTTIEFSEFVNGGSAANPGYQHNVYINHIDTLVFRYNYSHEAIAEGHELKSRAKYNFILYNRIANELSTDSRTIDLPNGGTAVLVGNIIEQGRNSANSNLFGYGLEGLSNLAPHQMWLSNNTFINKKSTGSFVHIANGTDTLFMKNNILVGAKTGGLILGTAAVIDSSHNLIRNDISTIGFVDATQYRYELLAGSKAIDAGVEISKTVKGYSLQASRIYQDTCAFAERNIFQAIDIGAYEYHPVSAVDEIDKIQLTIYPNPSTGIFYVIAPEQKLRHIAIFNLNGSFILESNRTEVSVENLAPGIYIIRVQTEDGAFVKKLVKQ